MGLNSLASDQEIKRAFKRLAVRFHPDKNPDDPEAEDNFKRINAAYQILSNSIAKSQYDRLLRGESPATSNQNTGGTYYYQGKKVSPNSRKRRPVSPRKQAQREAARKKNEAIKAKRRAYNKQYNKKATLLVFIGFAYLFILLSSYNQFNTKYHYYYALEAYNSKQNQQALIELENVLRYDESYAPAHFLIAKILFKQNRKLLSVTFFNKAIENLDTPNPDYFLQRGIAYSYLRNNKNIKQYFEQVLGLQQDSENFDVRKQIEIYTTQDFEQVLELQQDAETFEAMGEAYLRLKNHQKAVEIYTIAIAKGFQTGAYLKRAIAYGLGKNAELAQQDFDIVVQNSQNSTQVIQQIADICQYQLQNYSLSEYFYSQLLEQEKTSRNYLHKAIVQIKQQKDSLAITELDLAIKMDSNFDSVYYLRAVSHVRLSQIEEACQDWTAAKNLGYKGRNSTLDFYCD